MVTVVTGASGYIGSHVVANLLARGTSVRATVRDVSDPERVAHLRALPIAEGGKLEIVEMDLFDSESVDSAIDGCSDLIHTAATVVVRSRDPQRKIVDPSVIGTKNVVSAVEKSGTIERIVHTSSTAAIRPMDWKDGTVLTTETWADDATLEDNPYGLAKVSAERLIRDWHSTQDEKSRPRLVSIHPCMVFGPPMSPRHLRGSLAILMAMVRRDVPLNLPMQINIVDVRDVAEAHVRALTEGDDMGRYLTVSGDMMMSDIAKSLKVAHPDRKWTTWEAPYWLAIVAAVFHPKIDVAWARRHLRKKLYWDATPTEDDLGMKWLEPLQSILDTTPPILESGWD
ncbi:MAG: NAD-dependent epimerase/dehydratase family protein [Candidatus Thermoplasmatota archaeon]|nr:NAD-dependent epimerase/dehydratase family protein [Candidatus Thermoplasmatota archaeon]MEE3303835.1 NAD-dependent epimerase/dehydratase family protein [Candidatus Thermoplasmatota archaeon]